MSFLLIPKLDFLMRSLISNGLLMRYLFTNIGLSYEFPFCFQEMTFLWVSFWFQKLTFLWGHWFQMTLLWDTFLLRLLLLMSFLLFFTKTDFLMSFLLIPKLDFLMRSLISNDLLMRYLFTKIALSYGVGA